MAAVGEYVPGMLSSFLVDGSAKPEKKNKKMAALFKPTEMAPLKNLSKKRKSTESGVAEVAPPKKKKKKGEGQGQGEARVKQRRKKDPELEARTVFIGNLANTVTKKLLKKRFKEYGAIHSIRFRSAAPADPKIPKRAVIIMRDFHPESKNLHAYVVYKEKKSAAESLKMNGEEFEGLHLRVDIAGQAKKHDNTRSVFVGNLPFDVREEDLWEHFEDCGDVENVRVIRDRKTGIGKGFGYVLFKCCHGNEYSSPSRVMPIGYSSPNFCTRFSPIVHPCIQESSAVFLALKTNEHRFKGRNLRVTRCVKKEKKGKEKGESNSGTASDIDGKKKKPAKVLHNKKPTNLPGGSMSGVLANKDFKKKSLKKKKKMEKLKLMKEKKALWIGNAAEKKAALKKKTLKSKSAKKPQKDKMHKKKGKKTKS